MTLLDTVLPKLAKEDANLSMAVSVSLVFKLGSVTVMLGLALFPVKEAKASASA